MGGPYFTSILLLAFSILLVNAGARPQNIQNDPDSQALHMGHYSEEEGTEGQGRFIASAIGGVGNGVGSLVGSIVGGVASLPVGIVGGLVSSVGEGVMSGISSALPTSFGWGAKPTTPAAPYPQPNPGYPPPNPGYPPPNPGYPPPNPGYTPPG